MKLREVAEVIRGAYLLEGNADEKKKIYKELTMVSIEPISFIDERKLIDVKTTQRVTNKQLTRAGDVIVSLYSPMIACYVEKGQEGYVVPHYMAIVRMKPYVKIDSRSIVHFINSSRGRRALVQSSKVLSYSRPTSLPLATLNEVELFSETDRVVERF